MQVSIFNQMYEHASQFDNELAGQPPSSLSEWLKRQRELLLTRLGECSYLDDCLSETAEAKSILLSKQMDLFIYAIKNAETAQEIRPSFAALFEHLDVFSQKLAKQLKFCTVERLIPIALFACREVLGDRRFMIAQQFIDLMRVQQEFSQARLAIKEQLVTIPKAITNDMVKLSGNMLWKINMGQLENCLSGFLNEWLESWATHPLAVEARYCTLFVSRVVREINQPSHFWELLLLRLERSLMSWSKMVTPATEVLLAAIERFDFINIVITKHQDHLQLLYPFNEIILLKMLFDARQISDLYQRWLQHTAFDSFHTLGLSADELAQRTASFTNILIENSERLHVDWLKNASDYCVAMMRATDDHQKLLSVIGHEVDIFSSKVAEGLTDSIGVKRINEQIRALFLVCRYASLATPDLLVARTLFRKSVVLALVTEQYDMVWKKHREISLALAQMDVAEQSARLNMQQVQPLMRELDSILSDVVRDGIMWWPKNFTINAYAIGMNGARGVDLTLLLVRIGLSRMMFGQRALSAVMSWQAQWLLQDTKQPVQYSLLRKTMRVVHAALDAENPSLDGVQLLEQLIRRIDEVTAVKNIPLVAESIVNNASFIGISRYADLIKSQPELSPACGNQQAWKLAIPDNLWTLNRISYIYSQGLTNPFQAFAWWWNIAIGKNLRRLPLPLLSINVDVLSLSLFDGLTSDEALGALKLIKAVYRESFGIDTDIYTTSPTAFVQTQLRGKIWQQVFATASTKGTLFSKHSKAVRAAAPAELELIATTLAELMARTGDQEGVWSHCQLLAPLFSTIVNNGTHAIEKAWLQWQNNVFVALPAGAATFWNTVLSLGLEQARQLGIAIKLQRHCEQVRQLAAIRMDEDRVQFQEASGLRTQQLN